MLKARMGDACKRVPTGILLDWAVRLASCFDSSLRQIVPILGKMPESSNAKAKCGMRTHPSAPTSAFGPLMTLKQHPCGSLAFWIAAGSMGQRRSVGELRCAGCDLAADAAHE